MFKGIKKFFSDMLTGTDNINFEIARWGIFISVLTIAGSQIYSLWKGQHFDPSSLGIGFATAVGGGAAGAALKDRAKGDGGDK